MTHNLTQLAAELDTLDLEAIHTRLDYEGSCSGLCTDDWFPKKGENVSRPAPGDITALTLCRHCPVKHPCLLYALKTGETGIWGGTSGDTRRTILRNLRKHQAAT